MFLLRFLVAPACGLFNSAWRRLIQIALPPRKNHRDSNTVALQAALTHLLILNVDCLPRCYLQTEKLVPHPQLATAFGFLI